MRARRGGGLLGIMGATPKLALTAAVVLALLCAAASSALDRGAARVAQAGVAVVQTTADLSQRMARQPDLQFAAGVPAGIPVIQVNDRIRYQRMTGFGAAMTDTSAWLLEHGLAPPARDAVMASLFGAGGIRLDFVRVPMGASDFTRDGRPYSYDEMPRGRTDPALRRFSIAHDTAYVLPALRQSLGLNPQIQILANPWSPPAWMKTNQSLGNVNHGGRLQSSAGGPLARYFVQFLSAYARAGIRVAAITPQNEPTMATSYPGLEFPETTEANWLLKDLQRTLRAAGLHPQIYGNDLGWGPRGTAYARALASGPAAKSLTGIAWHCYFGEPSVMTAVHRIAPRLSVILDECSPGIITFSTAETIIASMRNWASAVMLWNLALDPDGGPVQPPNSGCGRCTGLVTIEDNGSVAFSREYYQLGQASAFIQPGAVRIDTRNFVSYRYVHNADIVSPGLDDVAVANPDGSHVLLAYDNSTKPIRFAVQWQTRSFVYTLPARAMATFLWGRSS